MFRGKVCASAAPMCATVAGSSGYSPATARIPSVPKSFLMRSVVPLQSSLSFGRWRCLGHATCETAGGQPGGDDIVDVDFGHFA
jgi:hypothetical protein